MSSSATFEAAVALAVKAHSGQTTLDGMPYILHPLRVMLSFTAPEDDEARIAAVLHDVVEDSGVTPGELIEDGFPAAAVGAIDALSRRKGETYDTYIRRVATNELAVRVKIADLLDNLDPKRASTAKLPPTQVDKYLKALWGLQARLDCAPEIEA